MEESYWDEPNIRINVEYFLSDPIKFPWDWYGGKPILGMVHSYLCRIMSDFASTHKQTLKSNLTWMEFVKIVGASQGQDPTIVAIFKYCNDLYELPYYSRKSVAVEVLDFLRYSHSFKPAFEKELNRRYREGFIDVPEKVKTYL